MSENNFWHPGFAYEKVGGLYDLSILGSGDHNMSFCLMSKGRLRVQLMAIKILLLSLKRKLIH